MTSQVKTGEQGPDAITLQTRRAPSRRELKRRADVVREFLAHLDTMGDKSYGEQKSDEAARFIIGETLEP